MACFLVSMTEAIVVSIVQKNIERKERRATLLPQTAKTEQADTKQSTESVSKIPFSRKLGWLSKMLWGGAFLLAIEHIWHGEVVPWPPFLTAMNNPADIQPMLTEIATVGVTMALLVTAVWGVMLLVSRYLEKRETKELTARQAQANVLGAK
ncbi:MAG: hypothetical protein PHU79_07725 [Oscillospiraceae bacterium]|nr:hypothetical protein [Oscillospiraceae bacterium]